MEYGGEVAFFTRLIASVDLAAYVAGGWTPRNAGAGTAGALGGSAVCKLGRPPERALVQVLRLPAQRGVARLGQACERGEIARDVYWCVLTGSGLKDPDTAVRGGIGAITIAPEPTRLAAVMQWS